jgi:uncharacterized protein (TIGR02444 family)
LSLWDFAVSLYGRRSVEEVCLALQDDHDQCVPLFLWRLWALDRVVEAGQLRSAAETARAWEAAVVAPLRTTRRRLRDPVPGVADAARLALRGSVKAAELAAERVLLDALEASTSVRAAPPSNAVEALIELAVLWGEAPPASLLARLAAAAASATG